MSSSATSTCLPQELVDNIIDELKDDVASLRACSLVSKPWVYRSRKYLFETVRLPRCLLLKWLARIPASPVPPLGPHHHVRSLTLQPIKVPAVFCIQETLVDHLSSFTQLSNLDITGSHWAGWVDAFSDSVLVAKCFGGFGQTLRKLELTRVYLNLGALKALLDVFPHLEQLLIFSPMMVGEGANSVGALPHLRKHQDVAEAESSNMMAPRELTPVRFIDAITLLFPPTTLVLGVTGWPLHCRELVLMVDSDYGGDASKLLLDSTGPTLESLVIRNTIDTGNCFFPCRVCICVHHHNLIPFRLDFGLARKLSSPPTVENEGTIPRGARTHQCSGPAHSNGHITSPRENRLLG